MPARIASSGSLGSPAGCGLLAAGASPGRVLPLAPRGCLPASVATVCSLWLEAMRGGGGGLGRRGSCVALGAPAAGRVVLGPRGRSVAAAGVPRSEAVELVCRRAGGGRALADGWAGKQASRQAGEQAGRARGQGGHS